MSTTKAASVVGVGRTGLTSTATSAATMKMTRTSVRHAAPAAAALMWFDIASYEPGHIWLGLDRLLYVSSRSYSRNILTVGSVFITAASDNTIINIRLQTLLLLN